MTALKPMENLRVLACKAERYPLNRQCSMPICTEATADPHHVFPRSLIAGDSWFVMIADEETGQYDPSKTLPHVTGLCRAHHNDVEEHRSWIKLEDAGEFVWYDRERIECMWCKSSSMTSRCECKEEWVNAGSLNPQPGSVEGKPKRKRTQKGTAERASRKTISVRLPEGFGGDDWDELIEEAERVELSQPDTPFDPSRGAIAVGKLLVNTLERFVGRAG